MIPKIVSMDVYPVAGHDSMELNLSGAHAPISPATSVPDCRCSRGIARPAWPERSRT